MISRYKFVILGGGPAGLTFARRLLDRGETSFVVLEKEPEAGGLCRSRMVDGSPLDIGGGHFLDVTRPQVLAFLFRFLPESQWNRTERISRIHLADQSVDYPLEANLWQLPVDQQVRYLVSMAKAGEQANASPPEKFIDWIPWKLGNQIAQHYMLPYNRKLWGSAFEELGTYWLAKLPAVSFEEVVRSCLQKEHRGAIPAHCHFYYPKAGGYGEVWRQLGASLGDRLITSCPIESIDLETRTVNRRFAGERLVNTIPWSVWAEKARLPTVIRLCTDSLKHNSIVVEYQPEPIPTDAHWVYVPAESVAHHRILCRHNFSPTSGRGHWRETNAERFCPAAAWYHVNEYAYPLNTRTKPEAIKAILEWAAGERIHGLGRWGEWEHYNSDVVVERSLALADQLMA